MPEIKKSQLLRELRCLISENFSAADLDKLERIGSEEIFEEVRMASYEKQEERRLESVGAYA